MKSSEHKILALKYRPKNFKELIGQDIMVQTITNSIKLNKLPNAYLLTGIRGVGKTTTARLIAKAINCKKNFIENEKCNANEYCHCSQIADSKHLDVLEMDAASRTGIDDIREIIDSSKYNPTNAKYKIFIIDEVHMLSKQAFNGLLKTLEEPPPHLKFVFATTEVKKIPVTIISRCQRFDLHRVSIKSLLDNLKKISNIENGKISENALKLIAKASEGSVRDSLSLLDRALISQSITEKEIDEAFVRKMLGITDKSKMLELLKNIFDGNQKKSIEQLREMISGGIDPHNFLNDFLEIIYFIQQKKNLGTFESDLSISESEIHMIDEVSKDVSISTLVLFWQFIIKGIEELATVANPILSLEMLIVKLLHLKEIPSYEDLLNRNANQQFEKNMPAEQVKKDFLVNENKIEKSSKEQIKSTIQTKPKFTSLIEEEMKTESIKFFEDLIKISSKKKEVELKYDLEKNVNLIKFSDGKIDIAFNENLSKDFVRNLSEKLLQWTSKRWVITLTKGKGQRTYSEMKSINKQNILGDEKKKDLYKKFKNIFSDAELIEISKKD
ncbi:DNA polymerase III subunit gamma/tau [Pelagibacteraceae bacterium]|nr:DNA polymerase III subunit gamma/tau [Pelagibacteraceae bacterium]